MSGGPAAELRESVTLLGREWWLFVGGVLGVLCYGGWVLASGTALATVAPFGQGAPVATVADVAVDGTVAAAVLAWLVLPALVTVTLLDRRLRNASGNLVDSYRLDHPSVLLAVPGLVLLGCLTATLTLGQSPAVVAVAVVASAHLLFRTVAYGYRVYTLSMPRLFALLVFLATVALESGVLVQATVAAESRPSLAGRLSAAGVDTVVQTGLAISGLGPGGVVTAVVAVPAGLATAYLAVQTVVGGIVRSQAPLENPDRRAGQRFPIMPPVAVDSDGTGESVAAEADADESAATASDDRSETRVFTPEGTVEDGATPSVDGVESATDAGGPENERFEPADSPSGSAASSPEGTDDTDGDDSVSTPEASGAETMTAEADRTTNAAEASSDDGWMDDTAVFTADDAAADAPDQCPSCGSEIPLETTVTFCPNCGERLDD